MTYDAAISLIRRAVNMDKEKRYTEAIALYAEGVDLLTKAIKIETSEEKKKKYRESANQYLDRAERLKEEVKQSKMTGKYEESIKINEGEIGHGYERLFGRFLDESVTKVHVEDPYIRAFHQCQNFLRLCELVVEKCPQILKISLLTSSTELEKKTQIGFLQELTRSLKARNIDLSIEFSETLHDRQIVLSNGWIIKIGRGLDYFKAPEGKGVLGALNMNFRPCLETTVDVFFKKL